MGFFIGKRGLCADTAKVKAIVGSPASKNQKDLRKWLGFANCLHKYSDNYADMARPCEVGWTSMKYETSKFVVESPLHAPILALPDSDRPFNIVLDALDFVIGCVLL